MSLKVKYKDEHGIVHIDLTPSAPRPDMKPEAEISDPKFDSINNRFGQYDLFGGKYGGEAPQSLFRSRYNSIEEELANTPYAFATERSLRLNTSSNLDITIKSDASPSRDIEDDRFFNRNADCDLFGPQIDLSDEAFTVTQLIHAQDRYYDLSSRQSNSSSEVNSFVPITRTRGDGAFRVLKSASAGRVKTASAGLTLVSSGKSKREKSFAILTEIPAASRPTSPRSLPTDIRQERISPFRGRGFREETSRHNTPKTSAPNSRSNSPTRRRTNSLSRLDNMAQTATLPLPVHLNTTHTPRNFLKENREEIRELSELNREKHEQEAEKKRIEEEEAILREMGLLEKKSLRSRSTSRSNSPSKINLRSRSSSPSAILHLEKISTNNKEFINTNDGAPKGVTHRSRLRSVSRSQPQSNEVSPKHSKIPKRQSSVSPARTARREFLSSRKPLQNNLATNQRFISNSTSSIHEIIKVGSQVHDKRAMSKSNQYLDIAPDLIKGKPPISPGKSGPPPTNKSINSKRLSPIVGTPNKSLSDDLKPGSAKSIKPAPVPRKSTSGTTVASRVNSRPPSRTASRDSSPDKRTTKTVAARNNQTKPMSKLPNTKTNQVSQSSNKSEVKKPINRTNSVKNLTRTPSTKTLNEKPPLLKKANSKKDLLEKTSSNNKLNETSTKKEIAKDSKKPLKNADKKKGVADVNKDKTKVSTQNENSLKPEEIKTQDNETQYDKISIDKSEFVILTKKNIVSMTTAAITSQPLEVVTTVTNQLPAALEKAREKGIFERLNSKDSLAPKQEDEEKNKELEKEKEDKEEKLNENTQEKEKGTGKDTLKEVKVESIEIKEKIEDKKVEHEEKEKHEDKKHTKLVKHITDKTLFSEDNVKLRPLQPPYNNPQVERVKQKIDEILKEPEISRENILTASAKARGEKATFKDIAEKTKTNVKETKDEVSAKLIDIKDQAKKENDKMVLEIRSEATKIVESIITPVEEPKDVVTKEEKVTEDKNNTEEKKNSEEKKSSEENINIVVKKNIEDKMDIQPTVVMVHEKKSNNQSESIRVNETLVKGDAEVEVLSSNVSTPAVNKTVEEKKVAGGNGSDKSLHSNGGFPQSTSTTPKPPARTRRESKNSPPNEEPKDLDAITSEPKPPNICERLMGKCKSKCCPCCIKGTKEDDIEKQAVVDTKEAEGETNNEGENASDIETGSKNEKKKGVMDRINCFKKKKEEEERIRESEITAGRASIEFENETKRKRKLRDVMCGCCGPRRRVSDASLPQEPHVLAPSEAGCCGKRRSQAERRDSILSDRKPMSCCNNRLTTWVRGMCRRKSEHSSSRRTSEFSKNKSLSPTLPPEDTRKKLDTSLVEHTSVMRGAIPVLPIVLAYFCLFCNIVVPGLGTILSGLFCLCFGIPRFGVHDGLKHRIGSFVINLLVGVGQLFTVLFCLVGWGWSIWWGVIFVKISRKYRKLKAEAAAEEVENVPPVTSNNHARA